MKAIAVNICVFLSLTVHVSCFPRRSDIEYKLENPSYDETADLSVPEVTSLGNFDEGLSLNFLREYYDSFFENEPGIAPYGEAFKRQGSPNLHPCHRSPPNVSTIMGKVIKRANCKRRTLFGCTSSISLISKCVEVPATYMDPNGTLVSYVRDCVCAPSG